MRTEFLCVSVLRVASGHKVKLASCKCVLTHLVVYSTDRSKAVVPVLVLPLVALRGVLQPQTAAPPRPQEEEETDKSKQAQIEQTYEKHQD